MPIVVPKGDPVAFSGSDSSGTPRGERSTFLWNTQGRGVPRREDLLTCRVLERSHVVSLPMDTIIKQVTTTPWGFRAPESIDDPGDEHTTAANAARRWFDGGFNSNRESFDHWLKEVVRDIVSIDAGVTELVPDTSGDGPATVGSMHARDGATMTKNPDDHGRLPEPGGDEPAYYQFTIGGGTSRRPRGSGSAAEIFNPGEASMLGYGSKAKSPTGFSRDEIVWIEENPRTWSPYGFGRVQQVKELVELILNQNATNKKWFDANEIPEGVLSIVDANSNQIQRVREYWKDEVEGQDHKLPIIGNKTEYHPFRANPTELDFLQSQEWYHKLVWMCFGLASSEVGLIEDVNRAAGKEANIAVWRRTTKPLLETIAQTINTEILPFHDAYHDVDGELEFHWNYDNPEIEARRHKRQRDELSAGTKVLNEVRQERGDEPLPWGDMPGELVSSLSRAHPEWFAEELVGLENVPEPAFGGGGDPFALDAGVSVGDQDQDQDLERDRDRDDGGGDHDHEHRDLDGPLRNDQGDYPPLTSHADKLEREVARSIDAELGDLLDAVEDAFPDEREDDERSHDVDVATIRNADDPIAKAWGIDVDNLLDGLGLSRVLANVVADANVDAMDATAEWEAGKLEAELEDALDDDQEDIDVSIDFDVEDSYASEHMRRDAARKMVTVEETVKDKIRRTLTDVAESGGNVGDATAALRDRFDELTDSHSRLVARTETLSASRHGSQALGETSTVVGGKAWGATHDGRERSWHGVMDGEIVGTDDDFVVPATGDDDQPDDYPRSTFVVGGDQPFNCRCVQRCVLARDMPDEARALAALEGVTVRVAGKRVDPLTDRMLEIKAEHAKEGEDFVTMLDRLLGDHSITALSSDVLGTSKHTLYAWGDRFDDELANYRA